MTDTDVVHLRAGGTSLVLDVSGDRLPVVVHWGADLGEVGPSALSSLARAARPQRVSGGLDEPTRASLLPVESDGWQYEPGLSGSRAGGVDFSPRFTVLDRRNDERGMHVVAQDAKAGLTVTIEVALGVSGLLRQRLSLRNDHDTEYLVAALQATFPLPATARELLDTTGRHLKERSPQRQPFTVGEHVRASRRGRPGADATLLLFAGETGFGFRSGTVHGVHAAWSGNHRLSAVRTSTADAFVVAGELLAPGEGLLRAGETYTTPWLVGTWGEGLDEAAARIHDDLRARPTHPSSPRPVTLNTWEAVYFDHDLERLSALAAAAAEIGVERFVLDDGWFRHRRDDTAGLGDWFVDEGVWPDGLTPLIERVTALGLEFGLWVEPEMVNLDSDLARAHPEWILHPGERWPVSGRQQQVLDLAHPDAFAYLLERLDALLTENDIAYLKWDHNRDLLEAAHAASGRPAVHDTTTALYALLDELRRRHPGVEIESCASGGARVDLGILERTERIWVSDCIDPLERLDNQAYTNLLVPAEMMGQHVGAERSHSTGRTAPLAFQAAVALFGHFGIETDLTRLDEDARADLARWVALHKRHRALFHTGRSVHADPVDPSVDVRGVVADDGREAVFVLTQRTASTTLPVGRVVLPGLFSSTEYDVRILPPADLAGPGQSRLAWAAGGMPVGGAPAGGVPGDGSADGMTLTGRMLGVVGVEMPVLLPASAVVVELVARS
ncbi:alpha-galactosidase [Frondihabitans cladoniiphilus]|uniref:alpha-galactosidase n=1 Tax=Frondihabitans cladoniiphilus TaxID=715785 RepID=A0ABP8VYT9_9MICO